MATLSASSTLAQIKAAYLDNGSYAEDNSVTKARSFVTACRLLLLKIPQRASVGAEDLQWDVRLIRDEMRAAQSWADARETVSSGRSGSGVKFRDMGDFR